MEQSALRRDSQLTGQLLDGMRGGERSDCQRQQQHRHDQRPHGRYQPSHATNNNQGLGPSGVPGHSKAAEKDQGRATPERW
jgi:hypothetical protein